jgi:hypothetical protein
MARTGHPAQRERTRNGVKPCTLKNVATGLYVNPDGTGAQLRGESSTVSWGGAVYTWTAESSLPN